MHRRRVVPIALALGLVGVAALGPSLGCSHNDAEASAGKSAEKAFDGTEQDAVTAAQERERERELDRDYPLHGVVTGVQLAVHDEPDSSSAVVGWLRIGSRIRLKPGKKTTPDCASGWYGIHPRGWACTGLGIAVGKTDPKVDVVVEPPGRDDPLPYTYYLVKEQMVPEYHRLPSRDEQRAAQAYVDRYFELLDKNDKLAQRFLDGKLPHQITPPAVVRRYLDRGFYVAGTGTEVRAFRRFVRTVWGSYVKESQMVQRNGSDFHGVTLDADHQLPIAFALRTIRPLIRQQHDGGEDTFVDDDDDADLIQRQTIIDGWKGRVRVGDRIYHQLDLDGKERYARSWFIGVAEKITPPFHVADDEPWVHVDIGEQTLVLYRGKTPVYATLVSTGLPGFDTPTGVFTIQKKLLSDTMSNLGPDAGDERYRIEDVPWTEYFSGSVALHGAFWHSGFGLKRSHGCVNMSPIDAHHVFLETWPHVPEGWHGVAVQGTGLKSSHVLVTP